MTTIVSGSSITFNDNTTQNTSAYGGGFAFRNRIINGGMVIDQRNAGASVTIDQTGGTYTLDRWYGRDDSDGVYTIQQVSDAPTGFKNSLKITITTTDTSLSAAQYGFIGTWIEGYNTADLSFGSASASTVTLSFWVKSSVTGQFGGSITNSAQDRTYPFSFTISAANTWEQKTVTITGDTTGTWLTTNGAGIGVNFAVGIGSNFLATANTWAGSFKMSATGQTNLYATSAATLQFTGVQLEKGSTATSFDYRPYGQELALCQRYFNTSYFGSGSAVGAATTTNQVAWIAQSTGNYNGIALTLPMQMRAIPSITSYSGLNGASAKMNTVTTTIAAAALTASTTSFNIFVDNVSTSYSANLYFHYTASAEL